MNVKDVLDKMIKKKKFPNVLYIISFKPDEFPFNLRERIGDSFPDEEFPYEKINHVYAWDDGKKYDKTLTLAIFSFEKPNVKIDFGKLKREEIENKMMGLYGRPLLFYNEVAKSNKVELQGMDFFLYWNQKEAKKYLESKITKTTDKEVRKTIMKQVFMKKLKTT